MTTNGGFLTKTPERGGRRNAAILRTLMMRYRLSREDVARLSEYSVSAVEKWLLPESASSHRPMKNRALSLIEERLASRGKYESERQLWA